MIHKSALGEHGDLFPHDRTGHVPVHQDHWQEMQFDQPDMDPHEPGISAEEQKRRSDYLNNVWWPGILKAVENQRQHLENQHGESFMQHWHNVVYQRTDVSHGFGVE